MRLLHEDIVVFLIFKVRLKGAKNYRSISYLQRFTKKDKDQLMQTLINFWSEKVDEYYSEEIKEIVFHYKIPILPKDEDFKLATEFIDHIKIVKS
jgi:hypothetical protein